MEANVQHWKMHLDSSSEVITVIADSGHSGLDFTSCDGMKAVPGTHLSTFIHARVSIGVQRKVKCQA